MDDNRTQPGGNDSKLDLNINLNGDGEGAGAPVPPLTEVPPFQPVAEPVVETVPPALPVEPAQPVNTAAEEIVIDMPVSEPPMVETPIKIDVAAPITSEAEGVEPAASHRFLFAGIGAGAVVLGIILFSVFLFLNGAQGGSPVLNVLGVEKLNLVTFLMFNLVLILGILTLLSFVGVIIGIFSFMNAKREDKPKKKKGLLTLVGSALALIVFLAALMFSSGKLSDLGARPKSLIVTNPTVTIGLSAPVSILFDASQLPIDLNKFRVISYNWAFGDGESGNGESISHVFKNKPKGGIYEVTLSVNYQDITQPAQILEETFTHIVGIENARTFASFTATPEEGQAPLEISFDASESHDPDGTIVLYEWDFDEDGSFDADGVTTNHVFNEEGTYNVTLRVTDNNGEVALSSFIVTVKSESVIKGVIDVLPNDEVLTPDRVYQFDAGASTSEEGAVVGYEWNFGDGAVGIKGKKVTHTYVQEGIYTVSVKLEDVAKNVRVIEKDFTVSKSPSGLFAKIQSVPEANAKNQLLGVAPFRVKFDAGSSSGPNLTDYSWDFNGDGQSDADGQIAEYVFTQTGEFNTTLTIISADNKQAFAQMKVVVESAGLSARAVANPSNGEVPLTVTFDASSTRVPEGTNVVTFTWDFGDGTPLLREGARVTHKFTKIGIFTVKVMAITSTNEYSETTVTIHVNSTPLNACYKMSRELGFAPLTVNFDPGCSTGSGQSYTWDFGGQGVSTEIKPSFTFVNPGTYEIKLELVDSDNNVSVYKDTVTVK